MADLLESLMLPNSSQESFHSLPEDPSPSSPPDASSADHDSVPPQPSSQSQTSALQAAGLPIYAVDAYLAAPENKALLHRAPDRKNGAPVQQQQQPRPETDRSQPVSLASKSSYHVGALNLLCQQKGLTPEYQLEGDASIADFGGLLKIGDVTIASDERWHSKKAAKETLAEMGLKNVKDMETTRKQPGAPGEKDKNWIGMLTEYHQHVNPSQGPIYNNYSIGLSFSTTCTIPSRPSLPFGSPTLPFPSKKAARAHAARLAVEHLIDAGELTPDGNPRARKKIKLGSGSAAAVRITDGKGLEVKRDATYTQKVNDAYNLLGLSTPMYVLAPASTSAPSIFSGHAEFPNEPALPGEIGEVRNVFGRKNAKEEIAKGVWEVLQGVAAKRGVKICEKDGEGQGYGDGR